MPGPAIAGSNAPVVEFKPLVAGVELHVPPVTLAVNVIGGSVLHKGGGGQKLASQQITEN